MREYLSLAIITVLTKFLAMCLNNHQPTISQELFASDLTEITEITDRPSKQNTVMATPFLLLPKSFCLSPILKVTGRSSRLAPPFLRAFHTTNFLRSDVNPNFPEDPNKVPRVRRPGRYFAEPLPSSLRISNAPIYTAPAGSQVAFTKRSTLGFAALGAYVGYLCSITAAIPSYAVLIGAVPMLLPIPVFQYLSKPYVTRIFRLYKTDEPQTYENLVKDETLVVEQVGAFGRSVHATQIKLQDIRIVKERYGWVNWEYKDPESKEVVKMYVADNVGGIKMDRIWGIIEKNSGIDNGRSFLDEE